MCCRQYLDVRDLTLLKSWMKIACIKKGTFNSEQQSESTLDFFPLLFSLPQRNSFTSSQRHLGKQLGVNDS